MKTVGVLARPDLVEAGPAIRELLDWLKARGVNTALVKKIKERREHDKDGNVVAVTREIELHDRSGTEVDRVADRTEGRPTQAIDLGGSLGLPTGVTMKVVGPRRDREPQ